MKKSYSFGSEIYEWGWQLPDYWRFPAGGPWEPGSYALELEVTDVAENRFLDTVATFLFDYGRSALEGMRIQPLFLP